MRQILSGIACTTLTVISSVSISSLLASFSISNILSSRKIKTKVCFPLSYRNLYLSVTFECVCVCVCVCVCACMHACVCVCIACCVCRQRLQAFCGVPGEPRARAHSVTGLLPGGAGGEGTTDERYLATAHHLTTKIFSWDYPLSFPFVFPLLLLGSNLLGHAV